jgi:hypothetical protein
MKKIDLSDLKVGDKVFTMHNGWDTIFEIKVGWWGTYWCSSGHIYSKDGQRYENDTHPTLFHSEQEFREYWGLGVTLEAVEVLITKLQDRLKLFRDEDDAGLYDRGLYDGYLNSINILTEECAKYLR